VKNFLLVPVLVPDFCFDSENEDDDEDDSGLKSICLAPLPALG